MSGEGESFDGVVTNARELAIVGAGWIVRSAHLPAYRKYGVPVRGIYDIDDARAEAVASEFGIERVYRSIDELLDDRGLEVVDLAITPTGNHEVVLKLIRAGRHVLSQKPLAVDYDDAVATVAEAEGAGVKLAVNQQLRHAEAIAILRQTLREGRIGRPYLLNVTVNIEDNDWARWPWLVSNPELDLKYFSIHLIDAMRYLLGEPKRVFCTGSRLDGRGTVGETRTISTFVFDGDLRACVNVCHERFAPGGEARLDLYATGGAARVSLGWLERGFGSPDTCDLFVAGTDEDWRSVPVTRHWSTDAFAGPISSLFDAIATGATPTPAGR